MGAISANTESATDPNRKIIHLSEQLLLNVRYETSTDSLETALSKIKMLDLISGLSTDNARKTFWINIYNSYYQILTIREKKTKPEIFSQKLISIAETKFSLDDIEHGILRKYRWKYSLGYLPQFFPAKIIKQLSVSKIDYRIHFALNCGAKSCPPIAFYEYDFLDKQLETAALSFLSTETEIDSLKKEVKVTKIMQWFKADFGGKKGIKSILSKYLNKNFSEYSVQFKNYDWRQELKNYTSQSITHSAITCPNCGHKKIETMPTDACQFFYQCENCKTTLRPKQGDCCVYCSYGTIKCPSMQ